MKSGKDGADGEDRREDRTDHGYANVISLARLTMAAGLLLVWIVAGFFLFRDFQTTRTQEGQNLLRLCQSAADQVREQINGTHLFMETMDAWLGENPGIDPRFDPEFSNLISVFRDHSGGRIDIFLISSFGGAFTVPSKTSEPLADVRDREYFLVQKDPAARGLSLCAPVKSRIDGGWVIPIAYSLSEERAGISMLVGTMEFPGLEAAFGGLVPAANGAFFIIRRDDLVLARIPFDEAFVGKRALDPGFIAAYGAADSGVYELHPPGTAGKERFMAFHAVDEYPLVVAISQDLSGIAAAVARRNAFWFALLISGSAGMIVLFVRLRFILVRQKRLQDELRRVSREDSLTGLYNRGYFLSRASEELRRSDRCGTPLSFAIMDIDFFKAINDYYGHPQGDRVLALIAEAIRASVRDVDIVGRLGGDEFGILLCDSSGDGARAVLDRLCDSVRAIVLPEGPGERTGSPAISIGVAVRPPKGPALTELYAMADIALYRAKEGGRDRVEFAAP